MMTNLFKVVRHTWEVCGPGGNKSSLLLHLVTIPFLALSQQTLFKPRKSLFQYFGPFLSPFFLCSLPPHCSFSISQSLQPLSESSHISSVAVSLLSPLPFESLSFLSSLIFLVCCSTSEIQRGAFCVWLCPEGGRLARQINNYRVHNIGENNFRIFDVKHERDQNYKEKGLTRKGPESWSFFLSVSLSLALILSFGSISCYCCCLLFGSALKT